MDMKDIKKPPQEVSETLLPVSETNPNSESPPPSPPDNKKQAWIVLFIHAACCIALALAMAFGLDGYKAGDKSTPHRVEGKLLLRVADVTTLVSVALVVVKIIIGLWSTLVLWGFAQHMFKDKSVPPKNVWKMVRWRLPPELQTLKSVPKGFNGWIISITVIIIFVQAFTGPVLTGSVNWNAAFHLSKKAVSVSSVDPEASASYWYWYNAQGSFDKRAYVRTATGYANLAWADTSTVDNKGKSRTGNGCRSVIHDNGLPRNSSLIDATLPCIKINSIRWYRNENELADEEWDGLSGDDITLVGEDPFGYYRAGVTLVYDAKNLRHLPEDWEAIPKPKKHSGSLTVALMLARRTYETDPECGKLPNTIFGNVAKLPYLMESAKPTSGNENCFIIGKIDFTAGVTKSARSTYIGSRIVESQTPIEDVVFEPDPWVQEAIWLLPDVLTMLAVTNVSLPPAFDNIDNYVSGIVSQGYLAAWDTLHHTFDEKGPVYQAFPAQERLVADVSFARVFAWLGVSLLMTVCGVLALLFVLRSEDLRSPESTDVVSAGGMEGVDKVTGQYYGSPKGA